MKYPMYTYRDIKVGFMPPQCDQSDQAAIRGFCYAVNGNNGMMNYSPKDFDLFKIGEFDTETGVVTPCTPELLYAGVNAIGE